MVGVVSLEDVLEQAMGTKMMDEFDQHDDLRAVAAHDAEADKKSHHSA
jgi:CBS domain containing-hemolysin-like protein